MSIQTISENLFEQLCAQKNIVCTRIPTTTTKSAVDQLEIGQLTLITEVKQLDPSPKEHHIAKTWGTAQCSGVVAPSDRVQGLLEEGYPQIKQSAKGKLSAMIVVYNNSEDWNYIDSFTVSKAMFGTFGLFLTLQPNKTIGVAGQGYMDKRKTTKATCRMLSAVGVLKNVRKDELALDCYHNPFATFPINTATLSTLADAQFLHPNPHARGHIQWQPIAI